MAGVVVNYLATVTYGLSRMWREKQEDKGGAVSIRGGGREGEFGDI